MAFTPYQKQSGPPAPAGKGNPSLAGLHKAVKKTKPAPKSAPPMNSGGPAAC